MEINKWLNMTRLDTSHSQRLNGKAVSTGLWLIVSNRDVVNQDTQINIILKLYMYYEVLYTMGETLGT